MSRKDTNPHETRHPVVADSNAVDISRNVRKPIMWIYKGLTKLPVYKKGDLWYAVKRGKKGEKKRIRLFQGDIVLKKIHDSLRTVIYVEVRSRGRRWSKVYTQYGDFIRDFAKNAPGRLNLSYARDFARALLNATPTEEEKLVVGIMDDGPHDPFGLLDKAVYPPTWLPQLAEWIKRWYGPNADFFLALVAIDLAKLIAYVVRRRSMNFVDAVVYMYSEGGQGKTFFLRNVLMTINGGEALESPVYLSYLSGSVEAWKQMRIIMLRNTLPLLIDGQIIEYLDSFTLFEIIREDPIIATNTPFVNFMRRILRHHDLISSGSAVNRRFVAMELEDYNFVAVATKATEELKAVGIKPALGFMAELLGKYDFFKARDILELAQQVMEAIQKEYGIDTEPYRKAVNNVSTRSVSYP